MTKINIFSSFTTTATAAFLISITGWTNIAPVASISPMIAGSLVTIIDSGRISNAVRKGQLDAYLERISKSGKVSNTTKKNALSLVSQVIFEIKDTKIPTASYTPDGDVSLIWSGDMLYIHMEISDEGVVHVFSRDNSSGRIWSDEFAMGEPIPHCAKVVISSI
jgi:hypothetical protein